MIARNPRKITLIAGVPQNVRDNTKPPITYVNYYYAEGAATVEIGKSPTMTAGQGFPVFGGKVFADHDQSQQRYLLSTGGNVDVFIEEYDA